MKLFLPCIVIFSFFLSACNSPVEKKEAYQIEGSLIGLENGKAELVKLDLADNSSVLVDSAIIRNGKFSFSGQVKGPYLHTIVLNDTMGKIHFFLENSQIEITGEVDSLENVKIIGSREDSLFHSYSIDDIFDRKKGMEIMLNYPSYNFAAFTAYYQFPIHDIAPDTMQTIMDNFSEEVKKAFYYEHLEALHRVIKKVAVGQVAPGFSLPNMKGEVKKLSDFKGKYVLLDFWASWCRPCREANPGLVKAFEKYEARNFTILGLSVDENEDKWLKAIEKDHLSWPNLSNLDGWGEVSSMYAVKAIPQNFLLDPEGIIVAKNLEGDELFAKLSEILPAPEL